MSVEDAKARAVEVVTDQSAEIARLRRRLDDAEATISRAWGGLSSAEGIQNARDNKATFVRMMPWGAIALDDYMRTWLRGHM